MVRAQFAALDDLQARGAEGGELSRVWDPLAARGARGVDTADKDPQEYVHEVEEEIKEDSQPADRPADTSLGIGSLKGR